MSTFTSRPMLQVLFAAMAGTLAHGQPGSLQGSDGLGSTGLQPARLEPAALERGAIQAARRLNGASMRQVTTELVTGGLAPGKVKGAVSSVPPSGLGELFYGVAQMLEIQEGMVSEIAVGYYMAVLSDPAGPFYKQARRRLRQVLLHADLDHEQAIHLYDGGLATFLSLYRLNIGIDHAGAASSFREMRVIKQAYQAARGLVGGAGS